MESGRHPDSRQGRQISFPFEREATRLTAYSLLAVCCSLPPSLRHHRDRLSCDALSETKIHPDEQHETIYYVRPENGSGVLAGSAYATGDTTEGF